MWPSQLDTPSWKNYQYKAKSLKCWIPSSATRGLKLKTVAHVSLNREQGS